MKLSRLRRFTILAASITCFGGVISTASAANTYFIGEQLDYTGNGCGTQADLNVVTQDFADILGGRGYTGNRYVGGSSWPQDFREQCSSTLYEAGGLDHLYADTKLINVYAGHGGSTGNRRGGHWGTPHDGECFNILPDNSRLGTMAGSKAAYYFTISSCTMGLSDLNIFQQDQWVRQMFGYHNSPSVGGADMGNFLRSTSDQSNKESWLDEMEDRPGWGTGDNSPMVTSKDPINYWASWAHANLAILHSGFHWANEMHSGPTTCGGSPSEYYWYFTYINHGGC